MKSFLAACADFFFPPHSTALAAREVSRDLLFSLFRLRFDSTSRVYTALPYSEGAVRALIRANKYHADSYAATLLGEALDEAIGAVLEESALEGAWEHPLLVPIPASPRRLRERGYNQVARIVRRLPNTHTYEWREALKRKHRESQARVQKSERAKNIAGAFYVPERLAKLVRGRSIILIDDVCESGSTMRDARRALKEAGARRIVGVALAH